MKNANVKGFGKVLSAMALAALLLLTCLLRALRHGQSIIPRMMIRTRSSTTSAITAVVWESTII